MSVFAALLVGVIGFALFCWAVRAHSLRQIRAQHDPSYLPELHLRERLRWQRIRERGLARYLFVESITFAVWLTIGHYLNGYLFGDRLLKLRTDIGILFPVCIVFGLVGAFFRWWLNEQKFPRFSSR